MECAQCGTKLLPGTLFCPHCGTPVPINKSHISNLPPVPADLGERNVPRSSNAGTTITSSAPIDSKSHRAPIPPAEVLNKDKSVQLSFAHKTNDCAGTKPPVPPSGISTKAHTNRNSSIPQPPSSSSDNNTPPTSPTNIPTPSQSPNGVSSTSFNVQNHDEKQGLSAGIKLLWSIVGFILGIFGLLLTYLVNNDNGHKAKRDGFIFTSIGFALQILAIAVLVVSVGVSAFKAVTNSLDVYGDTAIEEAAEKIVDNPSFEENQDYESDTLYVDKYGNIRLYAIDTLDTSLLSSTLYNAGISYNNEYEIWTSRNLLSGFAIYDWETENSLNTMALKTSDYRPGSDKYIFEITSEGQHPSYDDAFNEIVAQNMILLDKTITSDGTNVYKLQSSESERVYYVISGIYRNTSTENNIYSFRIISESSYLNGALEKTSQASIGDFFDE